MHDILGGLCEQLKELKRYKARFGELSDEDEDERRGVGGHGQGIGSYLLTSPPDLA